MANNRLTPELLAELSRLSLLTEADIDTDDQPEVSDWSGAKRGAFSGAQIAERGYDVRSIANWLVKRGRELGLKFSNMSLNKLVYFALERSLVERGVLLTSARVEAWDHGPVFRELYQAFKGAGDQPIENLASKFSIENRQMVEAEDPIDAGDQELLEETLRRFGSQTAAQLRAVSHQRGSPWHAVWHYRGKSNPGMEITPQIIYHCAGRPRYENEE
ncbi:type II toxin-antitoxin system antitoxin SocA domain-containing protein [Sphingomonas sp. KR3-1]|uniref:Panacea domain-containing protein n=1 Tax=Sphingomonas sp. KR3-1 TaxID=3156611 RepID=UPI0032B4619A